MESTTLQEKDELLYQLGRILAHELNNPISAISSAAYLIDDFASTAEDGKLEVALVQPFIGSIREECTKLKNVVEEYSRYVTTRSSLPSSISLQEFLEARVREATADGRDVVLQGTDQDLRISADAGQLQQMVQVLYTAAFDAGATKVELSVSESDGMAQLLFTDNRPLDNCEDPQEAFEPVPSKRRRGLGLKLPTVKKIIDLHGGTVSAGLKEGAGCSVQVSLPVLTTAQ